MIKFSDIQGRGYDEQLRIFVIELKKTPYKGFVYEEMFLPSYQRTYTNEEVIDTFKRLGVDMPSIKHKKWYQLWTDDEQMRFIEALKLIKL